MYNMYIYVYIHILYHKGGVLQCTSNQDERGTTQRTTRTVSESEARDQDLARYVITESTVVKRYKVNRLTGARHLDSTRTEIDVEVYTSDDSLHRSFSFNARHK